MKAEKTRAKIISCTLQLIKESDGDMENVTIRMIAERASIGVGLTNHYFKSKDDLITECIESVFKKLFDILAKQAVEYDSPDELTRASAKTVMHFFIENKGIARAAILYAEENPGPKDYLTRITNSFAYCMVDRKKLEAMISNDKLTEKMKQQFRDHFVNDQRRKAFMITSTLKEAFMRKDFLNRMIGVDPGDEEQCDEYIDELLDMLL